MEEDGKLGGPGSPSSTNWDGGAGGHWELPPPQGQVSPLAWA